MDASLVSGIRKYQNNLRITTQRPHLTLIESIPPVRTIFALLADFSLARQAGGLVLHQVAGGRHQPPVSSLTTVNAQLVLEGETHLSTIFASIFWLMLKNSERFAGISENLRGSLWEDKRLNVESAKYYWGLIVMTDCKKSISDRFRYSADCLLKNCPCILLKNCTRLARVQIVPTALHLVLEVFWHCC